MVGRTSKQLGPRLGGGGKVPRWTGVGRCEVTGEKSGAGRSVDTVKPEARGRGNVRGRGKGTARLFGLCLGQWQSDVALKSVVWFFVEQMPSREQQQSPVPEMYVLLVFCLSASTSQRSIPTLGFRFFVGLFCYYL